MRWTFKRKTQEYKEKYQNLAKNGKNILFDKKETLLKDIKNFSELKDTPETKGVIRLQKLRKKLIPLAFFFALTLAFNDYFAISLVKGDSMYPTLENNQFIFISRTESLDYGDVIVFKDAKFPEVSTVVKRIIGFGGDKIECVNNNIYRNGKLLDEPYAYYANTEDFKQITVPENEVFVMGDNREHSTDSRKVGSISVKSIIGRVKGYGLNEKNYSQETETILKNTIKE